MNDVMPIIPEELNFYLRDQDICIYSFVSYTIENGLR